MGRKKGFSEFYVSCRSVALNGVLHGQAKGNKIVCYNKEKDNDVHLA